MFDWRDKYWPELQGELTTSLQNYAKKALASTLIEQTLSDLMTCMEWTCSGLR